MSARRLSLIGVVCTLGLTTSPALLPAKSESTPSGTHFLGIPFHRQADLVYTGPASRAYRYYSDEFKQWSGGMKVAIH